MQPLGDRQRNTLIMTLLQSVYIERLRCSNIISISGRKLRDHVSFIVYEPFFTRHPIITPPLTRLSKQLLF